MRYSHEYKLECIELYRKGIWPETPEGIKTSNFHLMVRYLYVLLLLDKPVEGDYSYEFKIKCVKMYVRGENIRILSIAT